MTTEAPGINDDPMAAERAVYQEEQKARRRPPAEAVKPDTDGPQIEALDVDDIRQMAEALGYELVARRNIRIREAVRFSQRPPEGMEAPVLRHLVREALFAIANDMVDQLIGTTAVDAVNSQDGKVGVLVSLPYLAPAPRQPVEFKAAPPATEEKADG